MSFYGIGLTLASVVILVAVWYNKNIERSFDSVDNEVPFEVANVVSGLLAAESEAMVRPGANVAIGFGGCLDRLANAVTVLNKLGSSPPETALNVNELNTLAELETTFAHYFSNGASAGRATRNNTFFTELEHALLALPTTRTAVGGNAPVMAKRFIEEGVNVTLGARMSLALKDQLNRNIAVVGKPIEEQDTHLILEYERGDSWGRYSAPRANRFIVHNTVGDGQFSSLLDDFALEVVRLRPSLVIVGGLRMMLSVDNERENGASVLDNLSTLLIGLRQSFPIHAELSSFPDNRQLSRILDSVVRHASSIGLNEQELPRLRRHLDGDAASDMPKASENSNPTVADILNDARSVFSSLRSRSAAGSNQFSRIHVHTLGFHAAVMEAGGVWPNGRAAIAKAALTSNRHTCGSREIDVQQAKLILDPHVDIGGPESKFITLDARSPAVCWTEPAADLKINIEICIAPVPVCKTVIQTVGGGDNVSAAGLVLQI